MRVLMLGWEFPPFIAGGLGTACHGLTKALDRHNVDVTFVLPKSIDRSHSSHVELLAPNPPEAQQTSSAQSGAAPDRASSHASPSTASASNVAASGPTPSIAEQRGMTTGPAPSAPSKSPARSTEGDEHGSKREGFQHVRFLGVPAGFINPYQRTAGAEPVGRWVMRRGQPVFLAESDAAEPDDVEPITYAQVQSAGDIPEHELAHGVAPTLSAEYSGDLLWQVGRFAQFCVAATRRIPFDVIHAHDWMTYPAGMAVARVSGRPLVVHVHSTEFDRSGTHVNQQVYDIERRGMHAAMRVIAVSQLTKNVIVRRYSVPDQKIEVVYNGVEIEPTQGEHATGIRSKDKIVLYFGRITYQKGPEYFIYAAKKVLEVMNDVKFVVAGSGDQAKRMIELAAELGIGHKILFTGFLRGRDIQRVFAMANLYVMPSVSEPFGIAPLEAMGSNVPVLISRSSGVSELLTHALKVDFWDVNDMANKIVAVLRHPPLHQTLREHGSFEVRKITWDGAATRCEQIYKAVAAEMRTHAVARA